MDTRWDSVRKVAEMRVEAQLEELGLTLPEPQGPTWGSGIIRLGSSGA